MLSINQKRALWRFIIFGVLGMFFEACSMAYGVAQQGNWSLRGASSPWMFPIYGLIGLILEPLGAPMRARRIPLLLRALVYVIVFYVVEFTSGSLYLWWAFNQRGVDNMHTVWDYGWTKYHLNGQVSLDMLPFWYVFCLSLEFLYRRVDRCAAALAHGAPAEEFLFQRPPLLKRRGQRPKNATRRKGTGSLNRQVGAGWTAWLTSALSGSPIANHGHVGDTEKTDPTPNEAGGFAGDGGHSGGGGGSGDWR